MRRCTSLLSTLTYNARCDVRRGEERGRRREQGDVRRGEERGRRRRTRRFGSKLAKETRV